MTAFLEKVTDFKIILDKMGINLKSIGIETQYGEMTSTAMRTIVVDRHLMTSDNGACRYMGIEIQEAAACLHENWTAIPECQPGYVMCDDCCKTVSIVVALNALRDKMKR